MDEDDKTTTIVASVYIDIKTRKLRFHPSIWEALEGASPTAKAEIRTLMAAMEEAARILPANATPIEWAEKVQDLAEGWNATKIDPDEHISVDEFPTIQ
jgi:hypothetical protein